MSDKIPGASEAYSQQIFEAAKEHHNICVVPPPVPPCASCAHWKPLATGDGSFGHCMRSAKFLSSPALRSDMDTCSKHELIQL